MGRTLHFEVTNPKEVNNQDRFKMLQISEYYNSEKFKDVWTCENFYFDPWDYYPNWEKEDNSWEKVKQQIDRLKKINIPYDQIIAKLYDEGWIKPIHEEDKLYGFCKVGGNEYNLYLSILL